MKKNIFVVMAAACMMIGTGVCAQNMQHQSRMMKERPTAEQMAQRQTDRMKEKLSLTDEQTKEVYAYNLQQIKEMQAQREQMRAARQAEAAKMKSILTPEQFEKWQEMQGYDKNRGRMQKDGKAGKTCQKPMKGDKGKKACCNGKKENKK